MRQPQVARLTALVLVLVLLVPLAVSLGRPMLVAALFLVEFLSGGARPALSSLTSAPRVTTFAVEGTTADRYLTPDRATGTPLVLVHGMTPDGKDDPRLVEAARLLARAGFDVVVPMIPGLAHAHLRRDDVIPVVRTIAARSGQTIVIGVSVGAGLALLAAADPAVRDRVSVVVSLGGYASAAELIRFYLTGDFAYGNERGHIGHDPALIQQFVAANPDLVDASAQRLLSARDPGEVSAALASLSPALRTLLDALSPERVVHEIRAKLVLVHGRDDPAVPYTESLRLAAARPERTRVVLVGVVQHVEGGPAVGLRHARDLAALWSVVYGLVRKT